LVVLIDPPNYPGHGRLWAHLASDASFEELHRFAEALGIPQRGFDRDHYDIPAERYDAVLAAGATPVSSRELIARLTAAGLRRRKAETPVPRRPGRPLLRPPRLRRGDTAAVAAPAGPVPGERLDAGLAVLRSWGLVVREMDHVRGRYQRLDYLAASDAERVSDLTRAWCDPEVRAVVCARGGYGAQRVVDLLDWEVLADAGPKVLVGFSDVTALHQAFAARLGLVTVHGPVVTSLGEADPATREQLRTLLFAPTAGMSLTPEPAHRLVGGRAEGVLAGGNLALLATEMGTPHARPATGAIVVLEDICEEPYRLDRMLTQLLRAGWFDGVRGIVLGRFTDCGPPEQVAEVLRDRLVPLGVPIVCDVPVGHEQHNLACPFGVPAVLDADSGTLVLAEAPLR
jgi:muramoyltetrapeptide carboxypeptidase